MAKSNVSSGVVACWLQRDHRDSTWTTGREPFCGDDHKEDANSEQDPFPGNTLLVESNTAARKSGGDKVRAAGIFHRSRLSSSCYAPASESTRASVVGPLSGYTILAVEDEPLVAMSPCDAPADAERRL